MDRMGMGERDGAIAGEAIEALRADRRLLRKVLVGSYSAVGI